MNTSLNEEQKKNIENKFFRISKNLDFRKS